jgi:hypothetical protein
MIRVQKKGRRKKKGNSDRKEIREKKNVGMTLKQ